MATQAAAALIVTGIEDTTADLVIAELNRRGGMTPVRLDPGDFPHAVSLTHSTEP